MDAGRLDDLVRETYDELRRIARRQLRRLRAGHGTGVLSAEELVHEAYLKLSASTPAPWIDEAHFHGVAARAMRQVLIDYARREQAQKRGGGCRPERLSARHGAYEIRLDERIALDRALERLDEVDHRLHRIVECLFFRGMTQEQVATLLDVSTRTIEREWKKAKRLLYRAVQ